MINLSIIHGNEQFCESKEYVNELPESFNDWHNKSKIIAINCFLYLKQNRYNTFINKR